MRLPENKIEEAIVHPESEIRLMAVEYFSKSFSPDPTVMRWVIQAIEKYGREDGYLLIGLGVGLVQTDESLQWILNELGQKVGVICKMNLSRQILLKSNGAAESRGRIW